MHSINLPETGGCGLSHTSPATTVALLPFPLTLAQGQRLRERVREQGNHPLACSVDVAYKSCKKEMLLLYLKAKVLETAFGNGLP